MKSIVMRIAIVLSGLAVLSGLCGCSNLLDDVYYQIDADDLKYIESEYSTAMSFVNELNSVMTKYDGTVIVESSLKSEINKIVSRYDKGVISGTLYLQKSTVSDSGPWTNVAEWTMTLSSKYKAAAPNSIGLKSNASFSLRVAFKE